MMSPEQIQQLQAEASARAADENREPMTIFSAETALDDARRAPWLGTFLHNDWENLDADDFEGAFDGFDSKVFIQEDGWPLLFMDKCGGGKPWEPALTLDELGTILERVVARSIDVGATVGIGIVEEGEFQCHLGLYVKA